MSKLVYITLRNKPEIMADAVRWFHSKEKAYLAEHEGFYERYGWEFLCMVQGDGEPDMTRMYIHQ